MYTKENANVIDTAIQRPFTYPPDLAVGEFLPTKLNTSTPSLRSSYSMRPVVYKHGILTFKPYLVSPMASRAAVSGITLHSFVLLPSHFLNACIMPSGIVSTSFALDAVLEQITTEPCGTNGRSSADAARIPYSWAKSKAARNADDSADFWWGAGAKERIVRILVVESASAHETTVSDKSRTHTKISKKASSTKTPSSDKSDCAKSMTSLI